MILLTQSAHGSSFLGQVSELVFFCAPFGDDLKSQGYLLLVGSPDSPETFLNV